MQNAAWRPKATKKTIYKNLTYSSLLKKISKSTITIWQFTYLFFALKFVRMRTLMTSYRRGEGQGGAFYSFRER